MKKLLLFLMLLAIPAYAIESAVIGTILKQEGTKILPADDVTELDVSGIICTGCGGGVSEGSDVTFGFGTFSAVLDEATGDEVALEINYTVNKASSGNDTGLEINMTDTASPGTSYGINYKVGGVSKFYVSNTGQLRMSENLHFTTSGGKISHPNYVNQSYLQINTNVNPVILSGYKGLRLDTTNFLDGGIELNPGTWDNTTGDNAAVSITPTYNQTSGDAANTDLRINRTQTAVGSGAQLLFDAQVDDVSKFSVTTDGLIDGKRTYGFMEDDNTGLGVPYNLTTAFQTYTSYADIGNSSDMTVSASNGTITLGSDAGGVYRITSDISVTGVGGVTLTFGLYSGSGEVATFERGMSGIHAHAPVLANLSSNAAYDTYSSISYLAYHDGDYVVIDESADADDAFVYDLTFDSGVLYPTSVKFGGVQYSGQAAHEVEARMWNYSTTAWVNMRSGVKDFPDTGTYADYKFYEREFGVPNPNTSYVDISSREAKMRIIHTSSGNANDEFMLGQVELSDTHSSAAVSFNEVFTLADNTVLSFKIKSNKALPVYFANVHFIVTKISD